LNSAGFHQTLTSCLLLFPPTSYNYRLALKPINVSVILTHDFK
jgi:hypothetical protein